MSDIDELIDRLIAEARAKGSRALSTTRVYGDEPILQRGSQMRSFLPEQIVRMRRLGTSPEARNWTDARLFVMQARLMADYEDDCPYHGTFHSYYPTYDAMDNRQLRGYFTWRAAVRQGDVQETSASFAYVYIYELLNGISVEPGAPAFEAIVAFWQAYRAFEPGLDRYVAEWLVDYVVWHDLDPKLAVPYAHLDHNEAVATLKRVEEAHLATAPTRRGKNVPYSFDPARDAELFDALDLLSTYRAKGSRFYRDHPDDLRRVCCATVLELMRHHRSGRVQGLVESLFGTRHPMTHLMFASAVFVPDAPHPDCTYVLDETCSYECRRGLWTRDTYQDGGSRSSRLGQALRLCDRRLREAMGYPHLLREHGETKYLQKIVDREVADFLLWRESHAPVRVEIDLSKLAGIRTAAASTRESLLIDEEREVEEHVAPTPQPAAEATPPAPSGEKGTMPYGLTPDELAFVRTLLDGGAPSGNADLMVDAINEKLFDLLGDTALEFGDDGVPALVEDYEDDLREALLDS